MEYINSDVFMSLPKVFNVGEVTLCMNEEVLCLYVGHTQILYISSIELVAGENRPKLHVTFQKSNDPEFSLLIEESMRLVKSIPWIKVS